jgi:hypothetical protein
MFNRRALSYLGIHVYGLASAAAGVMDFIWGDFDSSHQPIQAFGDHIPGREILAYITAIWMIAGGVAILWRRSARAGGAALAIIYFVFTVFWLPRLYTAPHVLGFRIPVYIGVLAGVGSQLIVVAAGALVYASLATHGSSWPRTILFARWIFGLCSIDFGLGHLTASGQRRLCPEVDATGSRILDHRNWNLLRTRRPGHSLRNSGRSGGTAAWADVFCL